MKEPTKQQINNCVICGWEYLGDGIFSKGDSLGYFTEDGWVKE